MNSKTKLGLRLGLFTSVVATSVFVAQLAFSQTPPLPTWIDPDAGLTTEEKAAAHAANTEAFKSQYGEWLQDFVASGRDARLLERRPQEGGRSVEAKPNLDAASRDARLIIAGVAEKAEFEVRGMMGVTTVIVRIDSVVKGNGQTGETVEVMMPGGPFPHRGYQPGEGYLSYAKNAPLLLPGDRAVLFVEEKSAGELWPQSFTGTYIVTNGRVAALEGNPFAQSVSGQTESAFLDMVRQSIR